MSLKELHEHEKRIYHAEADLKLAISKIGDSLAKKHGYKNLHGMNAVTRYLADKYHWMPHEIRRLSVEDLSLLLDLPL